MKKIIHYFVLLGILAACKPQQPSESKKGSESETDARVKEIISSMSLEEKVGQMTQITLDVIIHGENPQSMSGPIVLDTVVLNKAFKKYMIGSVLNTPNNGAQSPEEWNRLIAVIQEYALRYSKHKIPVLYGLDMIHGASYVKGATLFPQQIGMAATWNPELLTAAGDITAYETRACGVPWTFSPVMDLGIDPRWPRQWETFGEDPYLASIMGFHLVKGYEGENNLADRKYHIAACLKHFMGYSQPLSGKDRTPAWIPDHFLREYHLPSFKAGIEAGAHSLMVNSGEINGLPTHANEAILTGLLKNEMKFKGFVVSDWQDIEYLHIRHHLAESQKEAVKIAINAGIDMSMVPYNFTFADYLIELVKEGEVPESRINDAVSRILRVKMELGLFENPLTKSEDYPDFGSEKFTEKALQTASESVTLLKNDASVLPLLKNTRVLLAGPAANSMRPLNGGWSYTWQGASDDFAADLNTIFEAMQLKAEKPENITLFDGLTYDKGDYRSEKMNDFSGFAKMASKVDLILLCLGENSYTETPGNLNNLEISENQQELVNIAAKTGKPVVLVLIEGRPRLISKIEPLAKGILQAYLPGNYGGDAIAAIIFGETNPSGKLPYTYPRNPNSLEPYYIKYSEAYEASGTPSGTEFKPQYEFGYGLSYSEFVYSDLRLDKTTFTTNEMIRCSVTVENKSKREGKEVVQVFVSDHYASLTPSVKRLRAFEKIYLQAGENKRVSFEIPVSRLAFVNMKKQKMLEKGTFTLRIGPLSTDFSLEDSAILP